MNILFTNTLLAQFNLKGSGEKIGLLSTKLYDVIEESGRKTLKLGSVPTLNLPVKSHETFTTERRKLEKVCINKPKTKKAVCYKHWEDFVSRATKLKNVYNWQVTIDDNKQIAQFKNFEIPFSLPKCEVIVNDSLEFTCLLFGWKLPDDHIIYKDFKRSMTNVLIQNLLQKISLLNVCKGIDQEIINSSVLNHVIPFDYDLDTISPMQYKELKRHKDCRVLHEESECDICKKVKILMKKQFKFKIKIDNTAAKLKASLTKTSKKRIVLALQQERVKTKELKEKIYRMRKEIDAKGVELNKDFINDINHIMDSNNQNMTPFMKLFWEEQKKASTNQKSLKYHPMIIRFCLSLFMKSASAYDELRNSMILTLPSRRTLSDYKNAIRPSVGFNPNVIEELKLITNNLNDVQRFIVLSFDEIKISENLVYDKHSNELIGFVDLGDPHLNYSTFKDIDDLASHCLVYYIRGVAFDLKFALAYFATKGVTASQIMSTFWKAVSVLELECALKVIAAVSDGASPNRLFYKMHKGMDNIESFVVYRSKNIFADRYIYFFSDAPHLIKTFRNSLHHSGDSENHTRNLWNEQKVIWSYFVKLVNDDIFRDLKLLPKLTLEHVQLNSFSVMNVRLAAQILSKSVSNVLRLKYPTETHVTAQICELMDKFFDCTITRNQKEGIMKRKEFLLPYRNVNDARFDWLKNTFLKYFETWQENIKNGTGNFHRGEREKMFISLQTYEGLHITVNSLIEVTKFLLTSGIPFVLTERFTQDVLEEYFGRHRSLGRRNDNPTLIQLGYQSNAIRMQRSVAPVTGNTIGAHIQKRKVSWRIASDEPLGKRCKSKKKKQQNLRTYENN
ncbi:uncharacterized protein LOC124807192 isoform X3 [Hydra vulgaris]|uniref:uncharacterized protein LOC124807192 isoform X3 n=1 Tax=Hydra vulgaris TaxID=6087 RepID=UPI001F5FD83A|nr:uncharacterized protein LOC124807192 isoform X3 [Hydra vulgaris]